MTASQIKDKFGPEFVSETEAAGMSIMCDVIDEFKALVRASGKKVEWSSGKKCWEIFPKKKLKVGDVPSQNKEK